MHFTSVPASFIHRWYIILQTKSFLDITRASKRKAFEISFHELLIKPKRDQQNYRKRAKTMYWYAVNGVFSLVRAAVHATIKSLSLPATISFPPPVKPRYAVHTDRQNRYRRLQGQWEHGSHCSRKIWMSCLLAVLSWRFIAVLCGYLILSVMLEQLVISNGWIDAESSGVSWMSGYLSRRSPASLRHVVVGRVGHVYCLAIKLPVPPISGTATTTILSSRVRPAVYLSQHGFRVGKGSLNAVQSAERNRTQRDVRV
jgi:hypothetical protein